ncbi:MAG: efflux RND transporter periplasmic adaptor subunit [Alphaproteobacteria bacterium]
MKKGRIVALGVLVAAGAGGIYWWRRPEPAAKVTFRPVTVERGDLEVTTLATGVVQPQNRLELKPPIAGRVDRILVQEGARVGQGQVLAWMSSLERAALLDVARAKGPEEVLHWEELYKPAPLLAPLGGTIIARNVEPGQSVTTDVAVFVISDRLIVKAQVDETDIGRIAVGQEASVTLDAYSDRRIGARVDHIAYEAVTVNNVTVYEVDVLPSAVPDFMRSGMTANVTFRVAHSAGTLVVPAEAIEREGKAAIARVPAKKPKGPPETRAVETGLTDGNRVEVRSGLAEGDTVLVPVLELPEGAVDQATSPLFGFGNRRRGGGSGGGGRR